MGWHDEEDTTWFPDWAVQPLAWMGVLMAAVLPAGVVLAFLKLVWPTPPMAVNAVVYAVSLGLMVAAVKPWTLR